MKHILVINTGSTSTKLALYEDMTQRFKVELLVPEEELATCTKAVEQLPYRTAVVKEFLDSKNIQVKTLDIIVARGGPLPNVHGGAYEVNQLMIDVLKYAPLSMHESALSCMIAQALAEGTEIPVIIYDGVSTDEMTPVAAFTGYPGIRNSSRGHPLNARKVAREVADKLGMEYRDGKFIVAHLGGSISISAHAGGRIIDILNAFNGPMSPQRAGRLPTDELLKLCFSGKYTQSELSRKLNGKSGFMGYLGTQNAKTVFEMAEQGDETANQVIEAMAYQCAKGIAEMRIAINAPVDRIIFTGGMARSTGFVQMVSQRVEFIAPVDVLPGEFEMEALAEGALRVLLGKECLHTYEELPDGYETAEEFYKAFEGEKKGEER